jgi:hypothetical protein
MEEVLQYLEMKNHYYEKFYSITQKFLDQIARNNWKDLDFFVDSRERILNIIRSFDVRISQAVECLSPQKKFNEVDREVMNKMMIRRRKIADKILELDLQVIAAIDEYKNETIRELKKTIEAQPHLEAFEKHAASSRSPSKIGKA